MVVRLHNMGRWAVLKPGDVLQLNGLPRRKVRVEFNTEAPTRIDLVEPGNVVTFLAVVSGHEVVQFTAGAECHLVASSDGEVWYFTNDGDQIGTQFQNVSFTKIATRRARNPQMEMMMFKMQQNIDRRLAALAAEQEAWRAARAADPETGEVEEDGAVGDGEADDDTGGAGGEAKGPAASQPVA